MTTIYHNPCCSKSRATLLLLQDQGIKLDVVLYLETSPDANTLREITAKLGCSIIDIIRKGETIYKKLDLASQSLTESGWIDTVANYPQLLERPIVVNRDKAAVGRPPENVLSIL